LNQPLTHDHHPIYNRSNQVRDALVSERRRLVGLLQEVPYLEPYPSHANFILCKVTEGRDAKAVKDALAEKVGSGGFGWRRVLVWVWVGG